MTKKVASSVELLEVFLTLKLQFIYKKRDATYAYSAYRFMILWIYKYFFTKKNGGESGYSVKKLS